MSNGSDDTLSFLFGLVCGTIVGIAVASLFVPRSGSETREQVAERGIELKNRADDTVRRAQEVANETVAKVQTAAQELLQRRSTNDGATA